MQEQQMRLLLLLCAAGVTLGSRALYDTINCSDMCRADRDCPYNARCHVLTDAACGVCVCATGWRAIHDACVAPLGVDPEQVAMKRTWPPLVAPKTTTEGNLLDLFAISDYEAISYGDIGSFDDAADDDFDIYDGVVEYGTVATPIEIDHNAPLAIKQPPQSEKTQEAAPASTSSENSSNGEPPSRLPRLAKDSDTVLECKNVCTGPPDTKECQQQMDPWFELGLKECANSVTGQCAVSAECLPVNGSVSYCLCPDAKWGAQCDEFKMGACPPFRDRPASRTEAGRRYVGEAEVLARHVVPNANYCMMLCEWNTFYFCGSYNIGTVGDDYICELLHSRVTERHNLYNLLSTQPQWSFVVPYTRAIWVR